MVSSIRITVHGDDVQRHDHGTGAWVNPNADEVKGTAVECQGM